MKFYLFLMIGILFLSYRDLSKGGLNKINKLCQENDLALIDSFVLNKNSIAKSSHLLAYIDIGKQFSMKKSLLLSQKFIRSNDKRSLKAFKKIEISERVYRYTTKTDSSTIDFQVFDFRDANKSKAIFKLLEHAFLEIKIQDLYMNKTIAAFQKGEYVIFVLDKGSDSNKGVIDLTRSLKKELDGSKLIVLPIYLGGN